MTGALLGTKLYVPQLRRGSVRRPRLMRRMGAGADARLTLISAPAGFGKTTVLAAWLHEAAAADRSVAWLSLDATDNEPTLVLDLRGDRAREGSPGRRYETRWMLSRLPRRPPSRSSPRC